MDPVDVSAPTVAASDFATIVPAALNAAEPSSESCPFWLTSSVTRKGMSPAARHASSTFGPTAIPVAS